MAGKAASTSRFSILALFGEELFLDGSYEVPD
jgi:hypothetical protein